MLHRCYNPKAANYRKYGGRGVKVHLPWHEVETFIREVEALLGPRPKGYTLDRHPLPEGDYEPGNVRWATVKEQRYNRRTAEGG